MPRINITEKEMQIFERYLPPETMRALEEKILLADIPKGRECAVTIQGREGKHETRGIELTERWAIAPALRVANKECTSLFSRTKKALIHRPSGLSAVYGTKHQLLILWNKNISDDIKAEIEIDDPQEMMGASPRFVEICRMY
jgi:hypothetical protein